MDVAAVDKSVSSMAACSVVLLVVVKEQLKDFEAVDSKAVKKVV